jgi:two-component system osmolarity sensor histidine kinase EnvZ
MMVDEDDYLREGIIYDIEDMNGIIDQFIEYLRHHKREELICEDINALVADVVHSELKHQRCITFKSNPNIGNIPLSLVAIKRVVTNMIENALRYSEGDIEVLSYFSSNRKYVVIAVNDSGPGIPESELESVFEPFKQGDTARGSEGSGLGLTIIKRIVDMHDGKVSLLNRPEGGLSAQIYLPVKVTS